MRDCKKVQLLEECKKRNKSEIKLSISNENACESGESE
jgi:hypothetical protein